MIGEYLHEECAVIGVSIDNNESAGILYNGLMSLQHRGQEGSGIAVIDGNNILCYKDKGLVSEVFNGDVLNELSCSGVAIGHNRYSTTGNNSRENCQPFITEFLTGRIATVHNGNILNAKELKEELLQHGLNFLATSDSEVISSLIAYEIVKSNDLIEGITNAASRIKGAFSLIILCNDGNMVAVRDPRGFRPLCIGKNKNGMIVASESCAIDTCEFNFFRDVKPGEIVVIKDGEIVYEEIRLNAPKKGICIFEYVYFARTDSVIDNLSVYEARYNTGIELAKEYEVDADVVCGVPDSGLEAAMGYSAKSGIPLVSGFVKNRYIGRSFIYPTPQQRKKAVKIKLNPLKAVVEGKRIVLIDDSIVRGTTCAQIIRELKNAGAKEVHMRISSPPFVNTCLFGTDIDSTENLLANQMTIKEMTEFIGADSLAFISIDGLKKACEKCSLDFCTRCFTGYEKEFQIELRKEGMEK